MSQIVINKAIWGGIDVKDIIYQSYFKDGKIDIIVAIEYLTDPTPGIEKKLEIWLTNDDKEEYIIINEGATFRYPENKFIKENCMIITSCNRVEQVLLAIAVNSRIIRTPFNLIVCDCSTDSLSTTDGVFMHHSDDPYNSISDFNYCSDWQLFNKWIPSFPNIKNYQVIHFDPRLSKQVGEASFIAVGSMMAAMMGSRYSVKLSGVCHLVYDMMSEIDQLVEDYDIAFINRSYFNQKSTRVMAYQNDKLANILANAGYSEWINDYDFIERKLETICRGKNVKDLGITEHNFIADGGLGSNNTREMLLLNLEKHDLLITDDYFINKFIDGHIW